MEWTKETIKENLQKKDPWVMRGLVAIYNKQTFDEQNVESTIENNGIGFNGHDAGFLSSLAKQVIEGRTLSSKQLMYGRKTMLKYAGQLAKIANGSL